MRPLRVRPLAETDVQAAFDWYQVQADGLGHEFLRAVDACYSRTERWPEAFPVVYKHYRRALLRRFPYLVYFSVSDVQSKSWPASTASSTRDGGDAGIDQTCGTAASP